MTFCDPLTHCRLCGAVCRLLQLCSSGAVALCSVQPMGPLSNPPEDYMCYSIFVTLCCCWLVGIFAIMRSSECRAAIASGDRVTAELRSDIHSLSAAHFSGVTRVLGAGADAVIGATSYVTIVTCHHRFFKLEFIVWARESYFSCYQKRSVAKNM